jgi:quercetin dioxygenase-like cupin family protein
MSERSIDALRDAQAGVFRGSEEGLETQYQGGTVRIMISAADTDGALGVAEAVVPPGGGPPMHVHRSFDELFYILEGSIEFEAGGQKFVAGPGATAFIPRGLPHRFQNVSAADARMLGTYTPAGFESWFARIGELEATGTLTLEVMAAVAREYDTYLC